MTDLDLLIHASSFTQLKRGPSMPSIFEAAMKMNKLEIIATYFPNEAPKSSGVNNYSVVFYDDIGSV